MSIISKLRQDCQVKIGLYSVGLHTYWEQFEELKECLDSYNSFLEKKLSAYGAVTNYGFVDDADKGKSAGEYFNTHNVDIIFMHAATYFTSDYVLPVHQICKAPVIVLNLQPTAEMDYEATGTDRWLAQCVACSLPEVSNAFNRADIPFWVASGLLGLDYTPSFAKADENTAQRQEAIAVWEEIKQWCMAAKVKQTLQNSSFGFLGGYYSGMLDMYSDFTMLQAQTGIHIKVLEMCDLNELLEKVTDNEIIDKQEQVKAFFNISDDSPSDPIAKKPTQEQIDWSCRVAEAQEKLVKKYKLDALAYYYHGKSGNEYERLQSGFIVGHSLLTAAGIPCAGEGDIKTAVAMKICDTLNVGGSFCEIVAADFNRKTMIIGHDGPFHIAIANEKPVLRGMSVYHGKRGNGISVEAKVKQGPVTTLGLTQTIDGKLKLNISEGEAINAPVLLNGNTSTHVRFKKSPQDYMNDWFKQAPTHHWALSVGHNAGLFIKVAELLNIAYAVF